MPSMTTSGTHSSDGRAVVNMPGWLIVYLLESMNADVVMDCANLKVIEGNRGCAAGAWKPGTRARVAYWKPLAKILSGITISVNVVDALSDGLA